MNSTVSRPAIVKQGFALVVTLSLMVVLVILALGLLSLSAVALRSSSSESAGATARANARLSLMLALGELQKAAGDDRRITVDASIFDGARNSSVLGVWRSWSPKLADNPTAGTQDYTSTKSSRFVSWLTSSNTPTDLISLNWAKTATIPNSINLFTAVADGFNLAASKVEVTPGTRSSGAMAWSVAQDASRAKINVGGPEDKDRVLNDDLQVQPRPTLAKSDHFKQPSGGWNGRAAKVLSMGQAKLDTDLWKGNTAGLGGADFTSQGFGLLTDPVNGGLKTDLSLGFEMSDSDFKATNWGANSWGGSYKNPFRAKNTTPATYKGQGPLFKPLTSSGSVKVDITYSGASTSIYAPAGLVPTFDTLRSFYRTPYHLYNTPDGPTVFERGMDHVALDPTITSAPAAPPPAILSQTGYRPVLDRVLYILSPGIGPDKEVRLIVTPVVTMWNPYNVALEIEGAIAYPSMDVPFRIQWTFTNAAGAKEVKGFFSLSEIVNTKGQGGRQVEPYFYAAITPNGSTTATGGQSIRFKPGEVRVFCPASQTDVDFVANDSIKKRTIGLRPVDNVSQLNLRNGIAIPMKHPINKGIGFSRTVATTDTVQVAITKDGSTDYPLFVGLEDATRAKLANPVDSNHGQAIADVQTVNFALSGRTEDMTSATMNYSQLSSPSARSPFGLIETYHRVAENSAVHQGADLVFTINPRQPYINQYLTDGSFKAAPNYETLTRSVSSINQVFETADGRSAYYGQSSNALTGKNQLSFFEVPQSLPLSLAAFQHADLSGTTYSPANQFGNSWASAYLSKSTAARKIATSTGGSGQATFTRGEIPVYDYSYLVNEALWDSFYFSGASATLAPASSGGAPSAWNSDIASVVRSYKTSLTEFIADPVSHPLRNPRMRLNRGSAETSNINASDLLTPEGCLKIAAHLYLDGSFNVNSTSEKAWIAFLSGMRDSTFSVENGTAPAGKTAFPRFRNPIGSDADNWMGFRALSDAEIETLAKKIIVEVKSRGPFLSLGEFVNRRVNNTNNDSRTLKGAVQSAIDASGINQNSLYNSFPTSQYPSGTNIVPSNTGVGIPGYLTQADVLQSIAPVMTVRSDTFTIRGYGEARDASGNVLATAWCQAVVQRCPEFVDSSDSPYKPVSSLNSTNQVFGRKFAIVSFRYLDRKEVI